MPNKTLAAGIFLAGFSVHALAQQAQGTPSTPTSLPSPASSGDTPPAIRFDDATQTISVPRPGGVTVTFIGDDIKIAGGHGAGYIVRRQKGGVKRTFETTVLHPTRTGGSLAGGGEEFLRDGGGLIYDSGMGSARDMQESKQVLTAKQLSQIVVDSVADIRHVPGHETFAPPGYDSLVAISKLRLRSDGSR